MIVITSLTITDVLLYFSFGWMLTTDMGKSEVRALF